MVASLAKAIEEYASSRVLPAAVAVAPKVAVKR